MYIVDRTARFVRGFLLSYGPSNIKKRFWDKEYSEEKWSFAYNTVGDCVYNHLEKHTKNATILDIGCGSGNTATEMAPIIRAISEWTSRRRLWPRRASGVKNAAEGIRIVLNAAISLPTFRADNMM